MHINELWDTWLYPLRWAIPLIVIGLVAWKIARGRSQPNESVSGEDSRSSTAQQSSLPPVEENHDSDSYGVDEGEGSTLPLPLVELPPLVQSVTYTEADLYRNAGKPDQAL